MEILGNREARRDPEVLEEGVDLVISSGSLEWCRDLANSMIEEEWKRFSTAVPQTEAKIMLKMLISALLKQAYEV